MFRQFIIICACICFFSHSLSANAPYDPASKEGIAPEIETGNIEKKQTTAQKYMVAAANPHAVNAGIKMLKKGGTAVDAMIAVQLVLNLVEPQSSGIGGGSLALYFDQIQKKMIAFDGRETAPKSVTANHFLQEDGTPMPFWDAVMGGKSVGVPGTVKLMDEMHQKYGVLPWKDLFEPAILLAEQGFAVSPRLAKMIANDQYLKEFPETAAYFFHENGEALQEGDILKTQILLNH